MTGRGVILKSTAMAIFLTFIFASAGNAVNNNFSKNKSDITSPIVNSLGGPRGMWEDDFDNENKIDTNPPGDGISENYEVSDSKVTMINTYSAWMDSDWTKMRIIDITNSAGQELVNYTFKMTIDYDSDMQDDYDDLRFKHEDDASDYLDYWIESHDSSAAEVWVKFSAIPTGSSEVYLFYGNPSADSASDFGGIFSDWSAEWSDDEQITNHLDNEGTWDPDVCFDGSDEFIIAWEEGQMYYPPYQWGFKQEIRASIYESDGDKVVNDKLIFKDSQTYYRNENPSIARGGSNWLVSWEHYASKNTIPHNPGIDTMDIYARLVKRNGNDLSLGSVITVCDASNCQADSNVEFDSVNNRFCIAWEDARNGVSNYNIYAKLYDTSGNQVGNEKTISSASDSQCEPWIAFDSVNERYLIVYEEGETPNNGPFDIWAGLFDENLNAIGSAKKLADGDDYTDYNFPCAFFNEETEEYLVTWNDGDISSGDYRGDIWGTILDSSGNVVEDNFEITTGNYVRTDIHTYPIQNFNDPYFVSYDDGYDIWGKLVTADGEPSSTHMKLCVSTDPDVKADWANIDLGNDRIFVTWEDVREDYPSQYDFFPDVFGNLHELETNTGSSVIYSIGIELDQILTAYVTSVEISKDSSSLWQEFDAIASSSGIIFNVLDGSSGNIIISEIEPGDSLLSIASSTIRLMANFTRSTPSYTPEIDYWNVTWLSNSPPVTPFDPDPEDGETGVDVNADLSWDCSDPDGDSVYYDVYFDTVDPPITKVSDGQTAKSFEPGTMNFGTTYYWKIVAYDTYGATTNGPVWSFTTFVNDPPYDPSDPDPEDGATDVDLDADLSWSGGDPNGDDVTYDIYFGPANPPPLKEIDWEYTTYNPGTMLLDTEYFWKIVSEDQHGSTTEGPTWSFTTGENDPPYEPSDPNPYDGETNVELDITLSWTGGDPNPGDPVKYDLYLDVTSPPAVWKRDLADTSYNVNDLSHGTTYYWKIVARDSHGAETEGQIWEFETVGGGNHAPSKPAISGPLFIYPGTSYNYNFVASDLDGDDISYLIQWGDGHVENWIGPYSSGETATISHTYTVSKTIIIIRCMARDIYNVSGPEAQYYLLIPKSRDINKGVININTCKSQNKEQSVKRALLILRNENKRLVKFGFTDRSGGYSFNNLNLDQTYTLKVIKPAYRPETVEINLGSDNPIITRTIDLEYVGPLWLKLLLIFFF